MRRNILHAGLPATLLIFSILNCGSARAVYKYQLNQVSRGDALSDESRSIQKPLIYENTDFKIIWSPGPLTFYFRIENKGKTDLQINFDKSFLISPGGNVFMAVHPANSALARGENFILVPAQVGVDSWVRPGEKQGQSSSGLAGQISPGFDSGGFFPVSGDANDLKKEYAGKKAIVVLNIAKAGKAESFRFALQIADIVEE